MGLACSWIAVRTGDKATLLDYLGMVETGELVTPGCEQSAMSVHQAENGWTILFSEDFAWADSGQILKLSRFGMAVGVQFEDKVAMEATTYVAEKSKRLWRVSHNAEDDEPLEIRGTPPKELAAIRLKFEQKQAEDDSADWLSEIPLELARTISGYRVDEDAIDFVALDFVAAAKSPRQNRRVARPLDAPMGWQGLRALTCSVIAVRTDAKEKVFDCLRRVETDRPVWPRNGQSAMSFYETDTGWIVLLSENIYWASDKRLRNLSRFGWAIRTAIGLGSRSPDRLTGALDGQILFSVPPSLENFQAQQLPADVRAALDEDWNKFDEDDREGRTNYAMGRAIRLLWAVDLGKPKFPFTALKRRWPWTRRATLLE
jgi:hypothetical protein